MKKILSVFILLLPLLLMGCKSVDKETVVEKPEVDKETVVEKPEVDKETVVEKPEKVILYWEYKDGEHIWSPEKSKTSQTRYEGEVINGIPNGIGTLYLLDGSIYVGEYKDGKYHGQGTFNRYDGSKYVGGFRYGELNGQGTEVDPKSRTVF